MQEGVGKGGKGTECILYMASTFKGNAPIEYPARIVSDS